MFSVYALHVWSFRLVAAMSMISILDQPLHFNHEYYGILAVFIYHSLCIIKSLYLLNLINQAHILIPNQV